MTATTTIVASRRRALTMVAGFVFGAGLALRRALAGERQITPWPRRSEIECTLPRLDLIRQDGHQARFPEELDDGWPIILNFFSTSCPACRTNNRILIEMQGRLGPDASKVRFVSISLDAPGDTPERLGAYARQLHAHDHWQFYTGHPDSLASLKTAFDAAPCDGSEHPPTAFLRGAPCAKWVRLEGYADAEPLLREFGALRKVRSFL